MAKGFTLGIKEEDLEKVGGKASFIGTSGLYDVTVLAVTVDENEHGSISLGLYVDLGNDNKQMLYGALPLSTYDNSKTLEGNRKTFGALCKLAGISVEQKFNPIEGELPIGKEGAMKEVLILDDITDVEVSMWVKAEYFLKGDNSIGEKRLVMRFYRQSDHADVSELNKPETIGTRFAKDEPYHNEVVYKEVTAEDVEASRNARKGGTAAPKVEAGKAPTKSRFGK